MRQNEQAVGREAGARNFSFEDPYQDSKFGERGSRPRAF